MARRHPTLAFLLSMAGSVAGIATVATAGEGEAVDKSRYTLFNAVPEAELRGFSPDRPAKGTGATTVDAGHWQYEVEAINYARQKTGDVKTTTWVGPNTTLKVGVTNWLDLEASMASITQITTKDESTGESSRFRGVGDLFLKAKMNMWGNDGGKTALALVPFVKVPTAPEGIGNGATEGGLIVPYSISLPNDMTLAFTSEIDRLKNESDDGYHRQFVNSVGLTSPIAKDLALTVELWSSINRDPGGTVRQYSFDTALAWTVRPNLQLDVGANIGLNSETPALQVYAGIAQRF